MGIAIMAERRQAQVQCLAKLELSELYDSLATAAKAQHDLILPKRQGFCRRTTIQNSRHPQRRA